MGRYKFGQTLTLSDYLFIHFRELVLARLSLPRHWKASKRITFVSISFRSALSLLLHHPCVQCTNANQINIGTMYDYFHWLSSGQRPEFFFDRASNFFEIIKSGNNSYFYLFFIDSSIFIRKISLACSVIEIVLYKNIKTYVVIIIRNTGDGSFITMV